MTQRTLSIVCLPVWIALCFPPPHAAAQTPGPMAGPTSQRAENDSAPPATAEERFSLHFQTTTTPQGYPGFHADYSGRNSLPNYANVRESYSATLYLGAKLWTGGEVYADPELFGGKAIGNSVGLGGYANGDSNRVSTSHPEVYLARVFYRQTIGFGGEQEPVAADQNLLAKSVDVSRLTLTLGKFSAADVFDANSYAHDPRKQFLNYALFDNVAWDYPADVRGYSLGGAAELNQRGWSLRYGIFLEPSVASGPHLDYHVGRAFGQTVEFERRYSVAGQPGSARVLAFWNRAHMGDYGEAARLPVPDIALTRRYSSKYGFGLNVEQQLADGLGIFARLGWADGFREDWSFTDVDRTVSVGLSARGTRWGRADDTVGLAAILDGLSADHRRYLQAGGTGILVGDGRLRYDAEEIVETYYALRLFKGFTLTTDVQFVNHPAYNRDRGPIVIGTIRLHYEF